jgi:hypothetical protein
MIPIRGRIGGNLGPGLVFARNIGEGRPLHASDTAGIVRRYREFVSRVLAVGPQATKIALMPTFAKSQVYCPKKTGSLVFSGYLEVVGRMAYALGGVSPVVEMGYGKGNNPFYTMIVHESMEYYHKPPTRAKWLEVALQEDKNRIVPRIAGLLRV